MGLDFRCIQNLSDLFCIFIISMNWLNSALHALLGVLFCPFRIILQNSVCRAFFWMSVPSSVALITEWTPYLTSIQRYGLNYNLLSLSLSIYIYIYIYTDCTYIHTNTHTHTHTLKNGMLTSMCYLSFYTHLFQCRFCQNITLFSYYNCWKNTPGPISSFTTLHTI